MSKYRDIPITMEVRPGCLSHPWSASELDTKMNNINLMHFLLFFLFCLISFFLSIVFLCFNTCVKNLILKVLALIMSFHVTRPLGTGAR